MAINIDARVLAEQGTSPWVTSGGPAPETSGSDTISLDTEFVDIDVEGMATLAITLLGTMTTGTITVYQSADGIAFDAASFSWGYNYMAGGRTDIPASRFYDGLRLVIPCAGAKLIRLTAVGNLGGTVTVSWRLSQLVAATYVAGPVTLAQTNSVNLIDFVTAGNLAKGLANELGEPLYVGVLPFKFQGTEALGWTAQRNPRVFKTAQVTASGSTALWTPAGGKKFRLMRYQITVSGNAIQAVAGVLTINLLDAAANLAQTHDVFVPAVPLNSGGTIYNSGWIDLENGHLSAAINQVLNVNLSAALTGGSVRVMCAGTEE